MKAFWVRLKNAIAGWYLFFSNETNGQIQAVIALLVVIAGFVFSINATEWIAVLLCIGLVIGLEMVNSALETLCDHLHPHRHESIRFIKDVAAGAVLWATVISIVVGLIVFLPRVVDLIG